MKMSRNNLGRVFLFILPYLSLITCESGWGSFSDITFKVFGAPNDGTVAAFGDFNSDQHVDIFFIIDEGHGVEIYLTHTATVQGHTANISRPSETITSVVPGDYDGDSHMDVMITTRPNGKARDNTAPTSAYVYWGTGTMLSTEGVTQVSNNMVDQPLVMDSNADMIPDFFGAEMNGSRYFWVCNSLNHTFTKVPITGDNSKDPFRIPNSHAFVDFVDADLAADLVVTSKDEGGKPQWEIWQMQEGVQNVEWRFKEMVLPPTEHEWAHVGQSTYADIDADGLLDLVVPLCEDSECKNSYVYAYKARDKKWNAILNPKGMVLDKQQWSFVSPDKQLSNIAEIPLTIRAGDVNLDSYPDFVCILQTEGKRVVGVLKNSVGSLQLQTVLSSVQSPVLAAFNDISKVGILDLVIVNQTSPESQPQSYVFGNDFSNDAYFITVQVLSGFECKGSDCASGKYTYGTNQPGPQIAYDTTSSTGGKEKSAAAQLCQSTYFSLQLPHVVMGLGQNPNFVDYLKVGVPTPKGRRPRVREFTSLIPNSQSIVIPRPINSPEQWINKLIITPGQSVILTGIILIATCVFIAGVAAVLQYLEKREDEIQKRQESHRFHFDAM